jgi:uncharacterized damage-inducible protein DinB
MISALSTAARRTLRALRVVVPVAFLLVPPVLGAQRDPVTDAVRDFAARSGKNVLDAARAMPADKYGFRPTPAQMSFGELVVHIEGDSRKTCSSLSGTQPPAEEKLSPTDAKAKLVAALDRAIHFCHAALQQAHDATLGEAATWYGDNTTRARPTIGILTDWADHYGQEAIYLRLNGILPPTARR